MATRAPEQATRGGIAGTYYAASGGGDSVPPGVLLHIKNGGGAPITPSFVTPGVVDADVPIGDPAGNAIAAGGAAFVRVPTDRNFVDPSDGLVDITWSGTTTVTFAVLS